MREIDKKRFRLIDRLEKTALNHINRLERSFIRAIIEELETILIIKDGKIENSTKNLVNLNKLSFFQDQFTTKNLKPFSLWIAQQLIGISKINAAYFSNDFNIKKIDQKVQNDILRRYGASISDKKIKVSRGSFIDQMVKFNDPFDAIRILATNAINQGIDFDNFRRLVRTEVRPKDKRGRLRGRLETSANNLFTRFDRDIHKGFAKELKLRVFIYNGGLIESSRGFCEERNGKVFTIEEAEGWKDLKWEGKPKEGFYDPLSDMGGHNCRHFPSFISEKEAIRRRPNLRTYFDNLKKAA